MRPTPGARLAAGVALGTAMALCLTGCQESVDGAEPAPGGGGGSVRLTAAQTIDRTAQRARTLDNFAADISETGTADGKTTRLVGSFRFRAKPTRAVSADFSQFQYGGQNVSGGGRLVLLDDVLYLNVPVLSPLLSGGRPWLRVRLDGIQRLTGVNAAAVVSRLVESTPSTVARMFTASKDVRRVGAQTIDGVGTTHYRGSVTLRAALSRLDEADREALRETYGSEGSNTISFDLWVDDQHRPRRSSYRLRGTNTPTSTTITYHYGQRFQVGAPPADQVGGMG